MNELVQRHRKVRNILLIALFAAIGVIVAALKGNMQAFLIHAITGGLVGGYIAYLLYFFELIDEMGLPDGDGKTIKRMLKAIAIATFIFLLALYIIITA